MRDITSFLGLSVHINRHLRAPDRRSHPGCTWSSLLLALTQGKRRLGPPHSVASYLYHRII